MSDVLGIATEAEVRAWAEDRLEGMGAQRPLTGKPEIAHFGEKDGVPVIGIAGRDHAMRTAAGAIEEGCELILAGLLLENVEETVYHKALAETREDVLRIERQLQAEAKEPPLAFKVTTEHGESWTRILGRPTLAACRFRVTNPILFREVGNPGRTLVLTEETWARYAHVVPYDRLVSALEEVAAL